MLDLNLSSNSLISMAGLENLTQVRSLNLSCNKLTQIFSLSQLAGSLKHLNLSHNRLVSIQPLAEMASTSVLKEVDLTDNYIGDISQLKIL